MTQTASWSSPGRPPHRSHGNEQHDHVEVGSAGIAPYPDLAKLVIETWVDWIVPRVDASDTEARSIAYAVLATLDGLLLIRHASGPDAAAAAARQLGIA